VTAAPVPCAASSLLAGLLDGPTRPLVEAARTRSSVHYETGDADVPVLSVSVPEAVRLPGSLISAVLPTGQVMIGEHAVTAAGRRWRVGRWWVPPRPRGLVTPDALPNGWADAPAAGRHPDARRLDVLRPAELVGRGPGLTPSGDDVLAAALVTAHATADPRLAGWRVETRAALACRTTTVVSRGLLRHALEGWATPELADFLVAACSGDAGPATARLLTVGHSSGAALAAGATYVLATHPARRRAAA
jgi:hypothetical protein